MRNIKLIIEYDGSEFCGWQIQKSPQTTVNSPQKKSIQQVIQTAIDKILQEKVKLIGSGRTDSGVHALGQVANFLTSSRLLPEKIKFALNANLPPQVSIINSEYVPLDFHSRYWAKSKKYRYLIAIDKNKPVPFLNKYAYWIKYQLDIESMVKAAKYFLGRHDFKGFCSSGSSIEDTVRIIKSIVVKKMSCPVFSSRFQYGPAFLFAIEIEADGFLYKMVRNIVGALLEAGRGKINLLQVEKKIDSKDRALAGFCAPARGLYLVKVKY